MKLKLDENGHVVVSDGKPVYVHDDGKEIPFDAPAAMQKISGLNAEAKQHRECDGTKHRRQGFGRRKYCVWYERTSAVRNGRRFVRFRGRGATAGRERCAGG